MKKRLTILALSVVLLLLLAFSGSAARERYVNEGTALDMALSSACAIGGDRSVAPLGAGELYALTASGLERLEAEDLTGGGGLRYTDTTVILTTDRVRAGLVYYYSDELDSSVQELRLQNAAGLGFQFGSFDDARAFVPFLDEEGEIAGTGEQSLVLRALGGGAVGVFSGWSGELLYSVPESGKEQYLALRPLAKPGEESLTWYAGRSYDGDFGVSDLGNGKLTLMNVVDIERYAMGVCLGEMGTEFPLEALKAQTVCARSFAMYQIMNTGPFVTACGFDVTREENTQAYLGHVDNETLRRAARETENQYVTYRGSMALTLYGAADGGETRDNQDVNGSIIPYLRGVVDPYEGEVWDKGVAGHQVGMSQWGAYAMAKNHNMSYQDILGFYYTDVGLSYGRLLD